MPGPRWLPAALVALVASAAWTQSAGASCARRTARQYVDEAELVFLGRAGAIRIRGKQSYQPITVLHVIKGKPGKVFTRVRVAGVKMPNDRVYRKGEVALFFVNKGSIDLCSGNFPLGAQMEHMETYLKLGRGKASRFGVQAVQRVVRELLVPYLHDRPQVPVIYVPLSGKRFRQGKSTLTFVKARRKDAIEIRTAVRRGDVHLISGVYHLEGFVFHALLRSVRGGLEVLYKAGWERKSRPHRLVAPTRANVPPVAAPAVRPVPGRPVVEVLFARQIKDRQPVDPGTTFSPGRLYCWNRLTSREGYYLIAHHWMCNGRRARRQPIQVRGKTWVTWSHFKVWPGSWTVRVTDESGMLLQSASFTVE